MAERLWIRPELFTGSPLEFARMRAAYAEAAGIPVMPMHFHDEFSDDTFTIHVPNLDGYPIEEKNLYGEWDELPEDHILILLAHSDEEGVIKDEHMLYLCARMQQLEPVAHEIVKARDGLTQAQHFSRTGQNFARGLANAHVAEKEVRFMLMPEEV